MGGITQRCIECREPFTTSASEVQWFNEHRMRQPKRCHECRHARRVGAAHQQARPDRPDPRPWLTVKAR